MNIESQTISATVRFALLLGALGLTSPTPSSAAGALPEALVTSIGVDSSGVAFFTLKDVPILEWGCTYGGTMRFDARTEHGRQWYSTLLAAKLSGTKVLVYHSTCYAGFPTVGWMDVR